VERGRRSAGEVRRVTGEDALVDTGATTLALPARLIRSLGLNKIYEKRARSTQGVGPVSVFEAVRLTILDRFCTVDVMEVPDDVPVLIGQIPFEMLNLVVDSYRVAGLWAIQPITASTCWNCTEDPHRSLASSGQAGTSPRSSGSAAEQEIGNQA